MSSQLALKNSELLRNIKEGLPELEALFDRVRKLEDEVYRFYHQSFKVYWLQGRTQEIVDALWKLAPEGCEMNRMYKQILEEGTGKTFEMSHNREWMKQTRPMVEAFFHTKYFLEMAVKYGNELEEAPTCLPSGWAALLYLYELR